MYKFPVMITEKVNFWCKIEKYAKDFDFKHLSHMLALVAKHKKNISMEFEQGSIKKLEGKNNRDKLIYGFSQAFKNID